MKWRRAIRDNGLSIVALLLFAVTIGGQAITGRAAYNDEARKHGRAPLSFGRYLTTGSFVEAVFENWESEFLQMAVFVLLTKVLVQKGSSESKKTPDGDEADAKTPRRDAPWPVRRGGVVLAVYAHSLSIALGALFVGSFLLHAYGGARKQTEEALRHGGRPVGALDYLGSATFWEESFQNWQSEFLSVAALVLLTIVLRERGSPQSKAIGDPDAKTGGGE